MSKQKVVKPQCECEVLCHLIFDLFNGLCDILLRVLLVRSAAFTLISLYSTAQRNTLPLTGVKVCSQNSLTLLSTSHFVSLLVSIPAVSIPVLEGTAPHKLQRYKNDSQNCGLSNSKFLHVFLKNSQKNCTK